MKKTGTSKVTLLSIRFLKILKQKDQEKYPVKRATKE